MKSRLALDRIPDELRQLQHWVCWRSVYRSGKLTKLPLDPRTGGQASSTNPRSWATFAEAVDCATRDRRVAGIGLMFGANGHSAGLVGVDLDHVRDPEAGTLQPWAADVVRRLASYTEVSPSGRGVHILVRATKPGPQCRKGADREMYDTGRYFTITGWGLDGTTAEIADGQAAIDELYQEWFGAEAEAQAKPRPQTRSTTALSLDDAEIVRLASTNKKNGEAFDALWKGDISAYPSASEATMALLMHLAFWCRKDATQMDRLFRESKLMRAKWDSKRGTSTWGAIQVAHAIGKQSSIYELRPEQPPPPSDKDAPSEIARARGCAAESSSTGATESESALIEEWDPPIELTPSAGPPWPAGVLPGWLEDYVAALAEHTQTPADLAAMLSLAVLAVPCANRVEIEIRPGYREPVMLQLAVALPPGERKSAVFTAMTRPLIEAEQTECERVAPAIRQARSERAIAEKRLEQLTTKAAKEDNPLKRQQLAIEAAGLAEVLESPVPVYPRWFADDSTPEALAHLMAEHDGRIAVLSAEGGIFDLMGGLYSDGKRNLDVYLKGHSGDTYQVDRRSGPPIVIPRPALTIGICVQPCVISGLAGMRGFRGRGVIARFLYSLPRSFVGGRKIAPPPVPEEVATLYARGVRNLAEAMEGRTLVLQLSPEAHDVWCVMAGEIEPRLASTGRLGPIADWGGKFAGAVGRIAALLHMAADPRRPGERDRERVTPETMTRAVTIGRYLIDHAFVAFGTMSALPEADGARRILEWLRAKRVPQVTQRDVHQGLRAQFSRSADTIPALTLLAEHGYLRAEPPPATRERGRPHSPAWRVHPFVCECCESCGEQSGTARTDQSLSLSVSRQLSGSGLTNLTNRAADEQTADTPQPEELVL